MRKTGVLTVFALIISAAGCASTDTMPTSPAHELRPHAVGWERFFGIDWRSAERKGQPIVSGIVHNRYGATATRMQLLVEALNDNGKVIDRKIIWLGDSVAPFNSASFETPVARAAKYRVSVFAYDWRGRGSA